MGEIFIEGIGVVEIEGDTPTEAESKAILGAQGQTKPTPQPPQRPAPRVQHPIQQGAKPAGPAYSHDPLKAKPQITEPPITQQGLVQYIKEATPATVGSALGAWGGSLFGPPGTVVGGMVGGFAGESVGQATGVAPESDLNLLLAAGGPAAGWGAGKLFQLGRRGVGVLITKAPFSRAAFSKMMATQTADELQGLGTRILANQTGLMERSTKDLFRAARRANVVLRGNDLAKTRAAITKLQTELQPLAPYPEVAQSIKVLENVKTTLLGEGASLDNVITARSLIGGVVKQAEKKGGVKFGVAKKIFSELNDDLDRLAANPFLKGRQVRLAKAAVSRAKLDFSVEELEQGVARFIKDSPDTGGTVFNVKGFQKWFRDITNPKHKSYNKNLSEALKDEIPEIRDRLAELAKIIETRSAAGPGSIVVRGQTAKVGRSIVGAVLGGGVGFGVGGAMGAAAGGVIGASAPEMIVAALLTKQGRQFLTAASKMGRGEINDRMWAVLGEILARQAGAKEDEPSSLIGDAKKDIRRQIETIR